MGFGFAADGQFIACCTVRSSFGGFRHVEQRQHREISLQESGSETLSVGGHTRPACRRKIVARQRQVFSRAAFYNGVKTDQSSTNHPGDPIPAPIRREATPRWRQHTNLPPGKNSSTAAADGAERFPPLSTCVRKKSL
jgi:hypothetical protein